MLSRSMQILHISQACHQVKYASRERDCYFRSDPSIQLQQLDPAIRQQIRFSVGT
jgi:hypothetical protein